MILLYGHFRYYILDAEVQLVVRAIMDVHGLGYQHQHQQQEHQQQERRRRAMLRTDISRQRAQQIRLPVFIDVMLRSAVAEDSMDFSTLTFRDSLLKSGI